MDKSGRLQPERIAFVFIDLQQKLLDKIENSERLLARNLLLLYAAQVLEVSYLVTSQYRRGLGNLAAGFAERVSEVIDKICFSCVRDGDFQRRMEQLRKEWIVLSGVETHICVLQTALDLLDQGYRVAVVSDAVGARGAENHQRGLARMENSGAMIVTTEMLIYELLGRSDTENFKKILPLIKNFQ